MLHRAGRLQATGLPEKSVALDLPRNGDWALGRGFIASRRRSSSCRSRRST
jgi:hypothetical protein